MTTPPPDPLDAIVAEQTRAALLDFWHGRNLSELIAAHIRHAVLADRERRGAATDVDALARRCDELEAALRRALESLDHDGDAARRIRLALGDES